MYLDDVVRMIYATFSYYSNYDDYDTDDITTIELRKKCECLTTYCNKIIVSKYCHFRAFAAFEAISSSS